MCRPLLMPLQRRARRLEQEGGIVTPCDLVQQTSSPSLKFAFTAAQLLIWFCHCSGQRVALPSSKWFAQLTKSTKKLALACSSYTAPQATPQRSARGAEAELACTPQHVRRQACL